MAKKEIVPFPSIEEAVAIQVINQARWFCLAEIKLKIRRWGNGYLLSRLSLF